MSNSHNQRNLTEQFQKAVSDGIASGDFSTLRFLVSDTVSDAISEAGRQVKNAADSATREVFREGTRTVYRTTHHSRYAQKVNTDETSDTGFTNQSHTRYTQTSTSPSAKKSQLPAAKTKNVGHVSSILYRVFGGIGIGTSCMGILAGSICDALGFTFASLMFILFGILLLVSIGITYKGILQKGRLERMKRYISLCAGKMYINISDLAAGVGKSSRYILKDIKKMLSLGFFPEGHLDTQGTCLMLDDATYLEYVKVERQRKILEADKSLATDNTSNGTSQNKNTATTQTAATASASDSVDKDSTNNPELKIMIQEGQSYIHKLHELNDIIEGEVISQKLDCMEGLLKEIFARLEEDPTQMTQMHKLMNYYLPTTIKLLQSYADFDDISAPDAEIISAKTEIEKTVDIINEAFTELLNKLFRATVYDVTTDAQVLQAMLAKEGLTKNDFSEDKK